MIILSFARYGRLILITRRKRVASDYPVLGWC